MINNFCKYPLWEVSQDLAAVAGGREPAETVIQGAVLVNVCTGELIDNTDVAIVKGRIALVGDAAHCIGPDTRIIRADGQYIVPGFLDGHIHIESSMMGAGGYAQAVIPHGTVGVYIDPHEICNVLGLNGVQCMLEDAVRTPLKTMVTIPSCVPAVPGFEDTGAKIEPKDVAAAMEWDSVVGLGEMMNIPGILNSDPETHQIVAETLKAGKIVTGHYSMPETGKGLNAYIASGMRCCHESTRAEDALAKMRLGMYAQLRESSAWHDMHQVAKCITDHKVDSRFACLVSDDLHPETLVNEGHMDYIIKRAVEEGIDVITAIQMATINCAQCFQMDHDLGSITPGKCADIVFLENLDSLKVTKVLIDGNIVAEDGKMSIAMEPYTYPDWAANSIHILNPITEESFWLSAPVTDGRQPDDDSLVTAQVIQVSSGKVVSTAQTAKLPVKGGRVCSDVTQDVLKVAVFERHHKTGKVGFGFCKGFGIRSGAMASTVSHDAHNLMVVGTNDKDMALAANALIDSKGGMAVVQDGKVLGLVPLPIAGLMSDKPAEEMAEIVAHLNQCWEQIGCTMASPFMTMALLALACLPELRLTDRGLVDCRTFQMTPLFITD